MIDKSIANQSLAAKIFGSRWKDTALHPFKFATGEGATSAVKTRAKGCLRLGAPISFTRLAGVPIKSASGASGNRRKRKAPKGIGVKVVQGTDDNAGTFQELLFGRAEAIRVEAEIRPIGKLPIPAHDG